MNIRDIPVGSFPDTHKHFAGIIGLDPDKKILGPCLQCGQGKIIQFIVGIKPPGSQETTPHIIGQACNVCGAKPAHVADPVVFLTKRNAEEWLTPPENQKV